MSHFTVMVFGNEPEKLLAPYQENNMGDCPKKYLTFRNVEPEHRKDYETDTKTVEEIYYNWVKISNEDYARLDSGVEVEINVRDPMTAILIDLNRYTLYHFASDSGNIVGRVSSVNMLSRDYAILTVQKTEIPRVNICDSMTWDEYMTEYCGYKYDKKEKAYGYWENPNKKWDWYKLGGRWNGYFKLKKAIALTGPVGDKITKFMNEFGFADGEVTTFVNMYKKDKFKFNDLVKKYNGRYNDIVDFVESIIESEKTEPQLAYRFGLVGDNGIFGEGRDDYVGRADQTYKENIDIDGMRDEVEAESRERYRALLTAFDGSFPKPDLSWEDFKALPENQDLHVNKLRDLVREQPTAKLIRETANNIGCGRSNVESKWADAITFMDIDDYQCTEDEYAKKARDGAISSFAIIKDGKWYERGAMGWWACVSDDKGEAWDKEFNEMFDSLPGSTLISVFDCHI